MRTIRKIFKPSVCVILVLLVILLFQVRNSARYRTPERVIAWDVISYYAYLPAFFIERDLSLSFTDKPHVGEYWPEVLDDGTKVIKTTMGVAFLYAPFFLAAHTLAPLYGFPSDGFSQPYALALILSCVFYVILGCFLLRRVLVRYFS